MVRPYQGQRPILELSIFNIHSNAQVRFWEDKWLGNFTLKAQYPSSYNVTRKKHITIANIFSTTPLNISFRITLVGDKLLKRNELVTRVAFVQLDEQVGSIKRTLTSKRVFTVQSMYKRIVNQIVMPRNKALWKLKVPLKVKIFVSFLIKGVI